MYQDKYPNFKTKRRISKSPQILLSLIRHEDSFLAFEGSREE
jgi:hypothetical protein